MIIQLLTYSDVETLRAGGNRVVDQSQTSCRAIQANKFNLKLCACKSYRTKDRFTQDSGRYWWAYVNYASHLRAMLVRTRICDHIMPMPALRWAVRKNMSALKITNAFAGLKEGSLVNIKRNINPEGESKVTESNVKFHSILSAAGSQQVKPYPCGKRNIMWPCACERASV